MKTLVLALVLAGIGAALYISYSAPPGDTVERIKHAATATIRKITSTYFQSVDDPIYRTERISVGPIREIISATGKLKALDEVIVGAPLSGQITEVLVDFNSKVVEDQVLARIDSRTFASVVNQAEADVAAVEAKVASQHLTISKDRELSEQARREYNRAKRMGSSKLVSEEQVDKAASDMIVANLNHQLALAQLAELQAEKTRAKAFLQQAKINLDRAQIRSPIDGVVIDRTIEPGQTVASSLAAPDLFKIARDLKEMEIEAYVDESDISQVRSGMPVEFAVDAHPGVLFVGAVRQIRKAPLDPKETSGVVVYRVIVDTLNSEERLLPGMTANIEFVVTEKESVPRVNNAAVRIGEQLAILDTSTTTLDPWRSSKCLNLSSAQVERLNEQVPPPPATTREHSAKAVSAGQVFDSAISLLLSESQQRQWVILKAGTWQCGILPLYKENGDLQLVFALTGAKDDRYTELFDEELTNRLVVIQHKASKSE